MSEHRNHRRISRPVKVAVCVTAATLLSTFAFAGSALADEDNVSPRDIQSTAEANPTSSAPNDNRTEPTSAHPSKPHNARSEPRLPANIVKGTPCTKDAIACVSLGAKKAWLFRDGHISYGPVNVSTGGPNKETPVGDHVVQWKNKEHKSSEFKTPKGEPAPMPFAVFFAEGGVAFHEGTLTTRSAGCVRLPRKDAEFFYSFLQLGDKVEVRG
jgi:hypothetical protein